MHYKNSDLVITTHFPKYLMDNVSYHAYHLCELSKSVYYLKQYSGL